ncbi:type II secretion system F family protein [bacterium]|nr:type II secretion system F family protein [bacterium]MCI0601671.1 type II secretion system F family protein [bacterium]
MAQYQCKYGTLNGEILQKSYFAESEKALREQMEEQGFYVFRIQRKFDAIPLLKSLFTIRRKKVTDKEFMVFNQEFAALIHAGLPLLRSLELLMERTDNPAFGVILEDVYRQVKSGTSLSEAFASHQAVFPKVYTAGILAGEKSGTLEQVIRRYLGYIKIMLSIRTKVTSSIIYPAILLLLSIAVIGVLVGYVIPKFSDFYKGLSSQLPWITALLVSIALFVRTNAIWMLPALVLGIAVTQFYLRTSEKARIRMDRLKLRLPYLGKVWSKFSISQLMRTLHTLLAGGIPLVNAMDVAADSVGNRLVSAELKKVSQGVKEGEPLWSCLKKTGLMTQMAIEMVKVGEETGALEEMLKNISDFYDEEIDTSLTNVLAIVEPVLLIFMGALVATILLAMYYPLFNLYNVSVR